MSEPKANEMRLVIRLTYNAPLERVYRAWTNAEDLARWYAPQEGWEAHVEKFDLRVGGGFRVAFGPPGGPQYVEESVYREIVPNKRLVFVATVSPIGRAPGAAELTTVEFIDLGGGRTELVLTDMGPDAQEHAGGWGTALLLLARALA